MAIQPYNYSNPQKTASYKGRIKPFTYAPKAPQKSTFEKIGEGAQKVTDFLGLKGSTDVIGSHIARATVAPELKKYIPAPSASQNVGAALQVGSFLIPAVGAEAIAGNVAKGAITKAIAQGAIAGGEFGLTSGAGQALTETPEIRPDAILKESLKQGATGAIFGSLLEGGGALAGRAFSRFKKPALEIPPEVPRKVPVAGESIESPVPISTPGTRHATYAKEQGYEPYTAPNRLPTIEMGKKAPDKLPVIQTLPPGIRKTSGGLTLEPIKPPTRAETPPTPRPVLRTPSAIEPRQVRTVEPTVPQATPQQVAPKGVQVTPKPVKAGGALGTSKIAKSINAKSIEKNLTTGFSELAGYEPRIIKEQSEKIASLMQGDMRRVRAIVRGEEALPKDVSGTYLIKAVEDHAIETRNGELLRELATSPHTSETSRFASELRLAAERDPESPLKAITDIQKARETRATRRGEAVSTSKAKKEVKSEIKKSAPKKEDWNSFITSITC